MLQLLNPIWLFGIAGILVPLIIHLWNVKTGKTLKVGSIMLMGESSRQNSRSLKLTDLLLLFLRCLLIIILSFMLAEPVWKIAAKKEESKAWVLLEEGVFPETYRKFKNEIDSLVSTGNEVRLFEPGFRKADIEELKKDTAPAKTLEEFPYWSLVKLMDQVIPKGSKAYIFTGDRLSRFNGTRPVTTTAINWKTYTPSDSSARWIGHAYLAPTGDLYTIVSESSPRGTLSKKIALTPETSANGIKSIIAGGQARVQLNDQTIAADTSTLKIAIYSEGFSNDEQYLTAALQAIQKYTSRKIRLVKPSAEQDILFWLSLKKLPANLQATGAIFQYAGGRTISGSTWIKASGKANSLHTEKIPIHKRIAYPEKSSAFTIWEDGFGKPVLDLTQTNNTVLYTFYSRLDPEWSDLVWSPEFVKLLLPIIIPQIDPIQTNSHDKRSITNSQITPHSDLRPPTSGFRPPTSDPGVINSLDLKLYLWLLLVTVLLTERYLSFRNNTN